MTVRYAVCYIDCNEAFEDFPPVSSSSNCTRTDANYSEVSNHGCISLSSVCVNESEKRSENCSDDEIGYITTNEQFSGNENGDYVDLSFQMNEYQYEHVSSYQNILRTDKMETSDLVYANCDN
uniref:Uncharacterized protein n=1 Tax=Magallana gigas TaxID=29159 RepID=K1PYA3_MAGGI